MKVAVIRENRVWLAWLLAFFLSVVTLLFGSTAREAAANEDFFGVESALQPISMQSYSGLAGLVAMVCTDASESFHDFYGTAAVYVEPFTVLGPFKNRKVTLLGATLADQMTSVINNDTIGQYVVEGCATGEQRMQGVLQEIDGYLRIHISGLNSIGERRSFVVNVEMSEPIYRALHTYIGN